MLSLRKTLLAMTTLTVMGTAVAEPTGATYLATAPGALWPAAAQVARGQWILLLSAGEVPQGDWLGVIERWPQPCPQIQRESKSRHRPIAASRRPS